MEKVHLCSLWVSDLSRGLSSSSPTKGTSSRQPTPSGHGVVKDPLHGSVGVRDPTLPTVGEGTRYAIRGSRTGDTATVSLLTPS